MTSGDQVRHLRQMLQLNPLQDSEAILRHRAAFLGNSKTTSAGEKAVDDDRFERHARACRSIEKVRDKFWTAPLDGLIRYLDAVDVKEFPELQATVARLRRLASLRGEFAELSQNKKCNPALFNFFKQVVVLPPREAGELKEKTLRHIVAGDAISRCRAMVRMLQRDYPHLYQLETDWFRHINDLKAPKPQQYEEPTQSVGTEIPGCLIWFLVVIAIRVIAHLAK